jgi:hypothetical protein
MPVPTPSLSATVSLGTAVPQRSYLGSFEPNSCYSFYRNGVRWMALFRYPGSVLDTEILAMAKSEDDGETWSIVDEAGAPECSVTFSHAGPIYDFRFAARGDVGIDPASVSTITAMFVESGLGGVWNWKFADFDLDSESWGGAYGGFTSALGVNDFEFSTAPDLSKVYVLFTGGVPAITGASIVGTSPWLTIDADGNAHLGSDAAFGSFTGNVRIYSGRLKFPQVNPSFTSLQILSRDLDAGGWDVEAVPSASGLFHVSREPWLYDASTLFFVGSGATDRIYIVRKSGAAWGTPEVIWTLGGDANPDLAGATGSVLQLCVSRNVALGGVDVNFEFDGLAGGSEDAMFTFHLEGVGAVARYYGR